MTSTTASPTDLADLAARTTGRVLGPADPGFAGLSTPWNVAAATAPVAVVEVAGAGDVAAALRFAGTHGLDVAVQLTGHGAVPRDRPTLLLQTGRLDELAISADGRARVGAGVRWRAVLDAAGPLGWAAAAGSAPDVGVVGYLTGGGLSPIGRSVGYASDLVTAFDVVTGDGEVRRATATENPALFWGLRGGKGALGVVTAVEFDLLPLREILGGCLYFDGADATRVAHAWPRGCPSRRPPRWRSCACPRCRPCRRRSPAARPWPSGSPGPATRGPAGGSSRRCRRSPRWSWAGSR
jgi:FAD/FMN-containing dehydrogenase